jgi:DNA polymerase-3 subunit gamma/tau
MYQALYRSFRPETFDKVLGQEHIVKILKNQIAQGTTSHAYLFCGTRGTGKTSTARILAKGVNCLTDSGDRPCGVCEHCLAIRDGVFLDVIEIDAASNNGVENIRELRESIKYPPVIGRHKVYIIDEVHMLSTGAFNALLKTLEEPPEHVMFILATTEPQKLPATILSRCLRLDFRRISERQMRDGLREILKTLDVKISDSALGLIVANADGSVRDGLSLMDQCLSSGNKEIVRQDVLDLLGTFGEEVFVDLTDMIDHSRIAEALLLLDRILSDGKDVRQLMKDWIAHYRSLLLTKFIEHPENILNVSTENVERIRIQSGQIELTAINDSILELSKTLTEARWSTQPRILLELCMVKMAGEGHTSPPLSSTPPLSSAKPKVQKPAKVSDSKAIWTQVIEKGVVADGRFNVLRNGSRLREISDFAFHLEVGNDLTERLVKEFQQLIEDLVEGFTGQRLRMECTLVEDWEAPAKTMEEVAANLSNLLNTNVEII